MPSILCTSTPTISVGTSIYTSDTLTTLVPTGYYSTGGNSYYVLNGVVQSIGSCSPSNSGYVKVAAFGDSSICSSSVVALLVFFSNIYIDIDAALTGGATIYTDSFLSSPLTGYGWIVSNVPGSQIYEINPSTGVIQGGSAQYCTG
jgi:hypothetical protein